MTILDGRFNDPEPLPHGPVKFASSPSDAYQLLLDVQRTSHVLKQLQHEGQALFVNGDDEKDWHGFINHVTPSYWASHTSELVTAASHSYPLVEEEAIQLSSLSKGKASLTQPPSYLPRVTIGLAVFEQPTLFFDYHGRHESLSAIGWIVRISARTSEVVLSIRGISWTGGLAAPVWYSDGGSIKAEDLKVDKTFRSERIAFTKWICTASMFLEQEILLQDKSQLDRGLRRRCEKLGIDPICHVIQLRKGIRQSEHIETDSKKAVEWSHQWVVRGHWRRQYYPKRQAHAPVWIHPHVKGPEDKPFVEAKPVVYSVSR